MLKLFYDSLGINGMLCLGSKENIRFSDHKEKFREIMMAPPIFPDDTVEQAIQEFEGKIRKIRIKESIDKAKKDGNIKELNRLLKKFNDI